MTSIDWRNLVLPHRDAIYSDAPITLRFVSPAECEMVAHRSHRSARNWGIAVGGITLGLAVSVLSVLVLGGALPWIAAAAMLVFMCVVAGVAGAWTVSELKPTDRPVRILVCHPDDASVVLHEESDAVKVQAVRVVSLYVTRGPDADPLYLWQFQVSTEQDGQPSWRLAMTSRHVRLIVWRRLAQMMGVPFEWVRIPRQSSPTIAEWNLHAEGRHRES